MKYAYIDQYNFVSTFEETEKQELAWLRDIDSNLSDAVYYIMDNSDLKDHINTLSHKEPGEMVEIAFAVGVVEDTDSTSIVFHFTSVGETQESFQKHVKMLKGERPVSGDKTEIVLEEDEDENGNAMYRNVEDEAGDSQGMGFTEDINCSPEQVMACDHFVQIRNKIINLKAGFSDYADFLDSTGEALPEGMESVYDKLAIADKIGESLESFYINLLNGPAEILSPTDFCKTLDISSDYIHSLLVDVCNDLEVDITAISDIENEPYDFSTKVTRLSKGYTTNGTGGTGNDTESTKYTKKYLYTFASMKALTEFVTAFQIKTDVYRKAETKEYQVILPGADTLDKYMEYADSREELSDIVLAHIEEMEQVVFHTDFLLQLESA